jgi:hypothetical protein
MQSVLVVAVAVVHLHKQVVAVVLEHSLQVGLMLQQLAP